MIKSENEILRRRIELLSKFAPYVRDVLKKPDVANTIDKNLEWRKRELRRLNHEEPQV